MDNDDKTRGCVMGIIAGVIIGLLCALSWQITLLVEQVIVEGR